MKTRDYQSDECSKIGVLFELDIITQYSFECVNLVNLAFFYLSSTSTLNAHQLIQELVRFWFLFYPLVFLYTSCPPAQTLISLPISSPVH